MHEQEQNAYRSDDEKQSSGNAEQYET